MASFIRANGDDLFLLAKVLGLNPGQALVKKELVPPLQGEMSKRMGVQVTGSNPSPLEDFTPILPIVGRSGDAPPPSGNSDDKGDGEEGVSEDPEDHIEPMDEGDFIIHVYLEPQRRVSLHVRSSDTIAVLKVHLQHMLGITRRDQRLHFMGGLRDLEDECSYHSELPGR